MRNLAKGNKFNFAFFAIIIILIISILLFGVKQVKAKDSQIYELPRTACIYDINYDYINLENPSKVFQKWTRQYYLKENTQDGMEYKLGNKFVSFDSSSKIVEIFGEFYQIIDNGQIKKLEKHNEIQKSQSPSIYKFDDRKYLLIAPRITNNTESLEISNYVIVLLDKAGNANLLNNEINIRTLNNEGLILKTRDFEFDVQNEKLTYKDKTPIDLKKIIGSTNLYAPKDNSENEMRQEELDQLKSEVTKQINQQGDDMYDQYVNTVNALSDASKTPPIEIDKTWVNGLNSWISTVSSGFKNIYNANKNKEDDNKTLRKLIQLNKLTSGVTHIDVEYNVIDPEDKYNVVFLVVTNGTSNKVYSLNKNNTSFRITNLVPDTNYVVQMGYKILKQTGQTEESLEDSLQIRTVKPQESLEITKITESRVYFRLKLDSRYPYDFGVYINARLDDSILPDNNINIALREVDIEDACSGYFEGSFEIIEGYKEEKNSKITITLKNTKIETVDVPCTLSASIINY